MVQRAMKRSGSLRFVEGIGLWVSPRYMRAGANINPLKRNTVTCMYHRCTRCDMAVKVNVGHGPGYGNSPQQLKNQPKRKDSVTNNHPQIHNENSQFEVTPHQKKANALELERMEISTKRLLSLQVPIHTKSKTDFDLFASLALVNEVRVALNYWASRWQVHYGGGKSASNQQEPNFGAKKAEILLDWILCVQKKLDESQSGVNFVEKIFATDKNAVFVNLIDVHMAPCQQQQYFQQIQSYNMDKIPRKFQNDDDFMSADNFHPLIKTHSSKLSNPHDSQTISRPETVHLETDLTDTSFLNYSVKDLNPLVWKTALESAFRVLKKMNALHNDKCCSLEPDIWSNNTYLLALSKLCHLLGSKSERNDIDVAFLEVFSPSHQWSSVEDVLTEMELFITKLENEEIIKTNDHIQRNEAKIDVNSYNIFLSALIRSRLPGSADKANQYLQRMEYTEDQALKHNDLQKGLLSQKNSDKQNDMGRCSALKLTAAYADVVTYNSVLNAFASFQPQIRHDYHQRVQNCTIAASILSKLEERYESTQRHELKPDTRSFATVLHAYANIGNAQAAEEMLHKIIRLSNLDEWKDTVIPNNICFNSTMYAWAKSRHPKAAENTEAILSKMEQLSNSDNTFFRIQPDTVSYAIVISAWARSGRHDCAVRAENLLWRSLDLFQKGNEAVKPDSITFNSVLDAWAKQNGIEIQSVGHEHSKSAQNKDKTLTVAAQRAESLVSQMEELSSQSNISIRPCTITYNILMDIYSKIPNATKAEELIQKMITLYNSGNHNVKPDVITFNSLLFALSSLSNEKKTIEEAEHLLKRMENSANSTELDIKYSSCLVKPDVVSYNIVMNALAKSHDARSAKKAEKILLSMIDKFQAGDELVKPNNSSFNIVMNAWSKSGSNNAANRANHLLEKMIEFSNSMNDESSRPDTISFTCVIDTLSKSSEPGAARRAEALLSRMYESATAPPNKFTFNSVINAWSRSTEKGAALRAEQILLQMEEMSKNGNSNVSPDSVTFSSVINAWARCRDKGAAPRAESILLRMEELHKLSNTKVKPTQYTYGSVLNAWAKSGREDAPRRALSLLRHMEESFEKGDSNVRPNAHCYNAVINTFAKSDNISKAKMSYEILREMINSFQNGNVDAKPNILTYSTVINACAYTYGGEEDCFEAFQIARSCLKDVLTSRFEMQPNNVLFSMFILAYANLVPEKHKMKNELLIKSIFNECCKMGLVDTKVISNLRRATSPDLFEELCKGTQLFVKSGRIDIKDIPSEWKCNIIRKNI